MTPAQASGHPTLEDVPVAGPTDPGMRAGDCWFAQNVVPKHPYTGCGDQIMQNSGVGEQISFGGAHTRGFSLAAAGDPDAWVQLDAGQQTWVMNTLVKLNDQIFKATNTTCPTFGPSITAAGGCFQRWFNAQKMGLTKRDGSPVVLRTDGVFDQDTLDALRTVVALHAADFPTPFPGTEMPGTGIEKKKLSTGAMVGIAAAGATVLGGIAYVATRKKSRRKRR